MFRSLLVPLKAVIMNLLSIGAAYGVIVAVFQWGWGADILDVSPAPIEPWVPMMLFAIVFGLSMDYEVFLLSAIREQYDRTGDNGNAVADGLASTARVITAAALIMVFVFGSFVVADLRALKLIGLGLAVAVAIDATIVRVVLVPATMELLGRRELVAAPLAAACDPAGALRAGADGVHRAAVGGRGAGRRRPLTPPHRDSGQRSQAVDALVVRTEVAHQHTDHPIDVQRSCRLHLLQIGPVLRAAEERLEHREIGTRQERQIDAVELLPARARRDLVVELRRVQEDVDGRGLPPQPLLAVTLEQHDVVLVPCDPRRQRVEHVAHALGAGEHVEVDVDRAPCSLRAPRERERATEGMPDPGVVERRMDGEHLRRDAEGRHGKLRQAGPNRGNRNVRAWRAGKRAASSSTSTSSRPRSARSGPPTAGVSSTPGR